MKKSEQKLLRKKLIADYRPSAEALQMDRKDFDRAVHKDEYQDILSTEECVASALDKLLGSDDPPRKKG